MYQCQPSLSGSTAALCTILTGAERAANVCYFIYDKVIIHSSQYLHFVNFDNTHFIAKISSLCYWSGVVVSALAWINEVNLRRARLVLRRATVSGFNSRCRTLISVCNLTNHPRPTQPSSPPGSVNEYQLRLGRQWQVWFIPLADERGVCR